MDLKRTKKQVTQVADLNITSISTGFFWGDAGIVFGNLPKIIYNKICHPTKDNKIKLFLNSMLIEYEDKKIIIDPGLGIFSKTLRLDCESNPIVKTLQTLNIDPQEITHVILTHLHPDHCGGLMTLIDDHYEEVFPHAQIIIQRKEFETAQNPDEMNRHHYRIKPVLSMLENNPNLLLIDGDYDLDKKVRCIFTGGHSNGHQIIRIRDNSRTIFFTSDLIPTRKHKQLTIISSQDLSAIDSFNQKKKLLTLLETNGVIFYYHDKDPWAAD